MFAQEVRTQAPSGTGGVPRQFCLPSPQPLSMSVGWWLWTSWSPGRLTQEPLSSGRKEPQVLDPSSALDSVAAMQGGSECWGARWRPPRGDSPPRLHRSWGPRLESSDGGQVGTELESFQKWLGERLGCDPEKGQHGREWGQCPVSVGGLPSSSCSQSILSLNWLLVFLQLFV